MQNGKKPAITIYWDDQLQATRTEWDKEQLKNPDMLVAVLGQAQDLMKFNLNLARMQEIQQRQQMAIQQQQQAMMQEAAIQSRVIRG